MINYLKPRHLPSLSGFNLDITGRATSFHIQDAILVEKQNSKLR